MTSGQLPDDFSTNLVNWIFELFVEPEITRRGLALDRDEVRKVVIELNPDRPHPPLVRLNDQPRSWHKSASRVTSPKART